MCDLVKYMFECLFTRIYSSSFFKYSGDVGSLSIIFFVCAKQSINLFETRRGNRAKTLLHNIFMQIFKFLIEKYMNLK